MAKTVFTAEQAQNLGSQIGINWESSPFDVSQFRRGLDVELEHGSDDPETNFTNSDPVMTAKIA
jgi:hypothetical protein